MSEETAIFLDIEIATQFCDEYGANYFLYIM